MNIKVDRSLKIPYYFQLYSNILNRIKSNDFIDGERLPNEMDLCKEFGVSRITVRQALKDLESDGLIVRERGKGTFIRKKIETHSLQKVSSIVDELKNEGINTKEKILEANTIKPDERIKTILNLDGDAGIFFVKRLIYAYSSPLYLTKAYFPCDLTGIINRKTLRENSFTKIITEIYNLKILHSKRILEPDIPGEEIKSLLEIKPSEKMVIHYLQTFWTVEKDFVTRTIYFEEYFNSKNGKFVFEKDYES